jgi:crotonobetainyl-CoA:carnitine CoA-transferase CaiB-like acyl-CoA transferase
MVNRNKYGVTLNITTPKGMELLHKLIEISDVFSESFSAGTAKKLGIDYPSIRQHNPNIIMLSMSGWGTEGPYKGFAALGSTLDGFTGHHNIRGYTDTDASTTPMVQHIDSVAAVQGVFAILTALHCRRRTGIGQWIDLSQVEGFLPHLGYSYMDYIFNDAAPLRVGNSNRKLAPYNCYKSKGLDDWIVINVTNETQWYDLCIATGNPGWLTDPRFCSLDDRLTNKHLLDALLTQWTILKDKLDATRILQSQGIPAQPVLNDAEVYQDPHLSDRDFFLEIDHKAAGRHRYPGFLWKLSKSPMKMRQAPNLLGEHQTHVLSDMLGLSKDEIRILYNQEIIGSSYPELSDF